MNRRNFIDKSLPLSATALIATSFTWPKRSDTANNKVLNLVDFGAKGDGVTDDTDALQKALNKLTEGSLLLIPPGNFKVNNPLVINQKQQVLIQGQGPGSKIIAGADMDNLLLAKGSFSGSTIDSVTFDAGSKAEVALRIEGGTYVNLNNLDIYAPKEIGIHGGMEDQKTGPEFIITNSRLTGMKQSKAQDPGSKTGILVEKSWTDSHYGNLIIRGFTECAMELRANSNLINKVHVYRYPAFQYFKGLSLKGNENYLVQAYFDNAIDVGCEILGNNTSILSSYVLRIALAFNNGPVAPGVGIKIGSTEKKIKNVTLINNSFVNHVPDTPEFAANNLKAIELVNGENIISYDNQYDRAEPGETRLAGNVEIPAGQSAYNVSIDSLVKPANIQLTPTSSLKGNYWISNIAKDSFVINLSEVQEEVVFFDYLTRE